MFDTDGNFRFRFGSPGSADGHFQSPSGVAVTRDGEIVVADTMNNRIQASALVRRERLDFGFRLIQITFAESSQSRKKEVSYRVVELWNKSTHHGTAKNLLMRAGGLNVVHCT